MLRTVVQTVGALLRPRARQAPTTLESVNSKSLRPYAAGRVRACVIAVLTERASRSLITDSWRHRALTIVFQAERVTKAGAGELRYEVASIAQGAYPGCRPSPPGVGATQLQARRDGVRGNVVRTPCGHRGSDDALASHGGIGAKGKGAPSGGKIRKKERSKTKHDTEFAKNGRPNPRAAQVQ